MKFERDFALGSLIESDSYSPRLKVIRSDVEVDKSGNVVKVPVPHYIKPDKEILSNVQRYEGGIRRAIMKNLQALGMVRNIKAMKGNGQQGDG